jgi:hypothetical protein
VAKPQFVNKSILKADQNQFPVWSWVVCLVPRQLSISITTGTQPSGRFSFFATAESGRLENFQTVQAVSQFQFRKLGQFIQFRQLVSFSSVVRAIVQTVQTVSQF